MTSAERVFIALQKKQPDRVPIVEWFIDPEVIKKIYPGCSYYDFVEKIGLDGVGINEAYDFRTGVKWIDRQRGIFRDKWGVTRKVTTELVPYPLESPIKTGKDLLNYKPPDPTDKRLLGELPEVVQRFKGKKAIIWWSHDAFIIPAYLRGMDNLFLDFIENPQLAKAIIEMCVDFNVEEIKMAIDTGAELIVLGDDYASQKGPMMSPSHFEEFILPGLTKIVQTIKSKGAYAIKHSDGNIWPILDKIVDTGIDAINPLEPVAGMDIGEVKEKYGHKVCVIGNIDCGITLSQKPKEAVIEEVKCCIAKASIGGGHIMSSSNSIHSSVKPENYIAMIEATKRYGKYPITL